jgi:hypothetical protein
MFQPNYRENQALSIDQMRTDIHEEKNRYLLHAGKISFTRSNHHTFHPIHAYLHLSYVYVNIVTSKLLKLKEYFTLFCCIVSIELPGVDRDSIRVTVNNGVLTIRAEKRIERVEGNADQGVNVRGGADDVSAGE